MHSSKSSSEIIFGSGSAECFSFVDCQTAALAMGVGKFVGQVFK